MTGCATKYTPAPGSATAELRISAHQFFGLLGGGVRAVYYRDGSCDRPEVLAVISKVLTTKSDATKTLPPASPTDSDTTVDRIIEASAPINITFFSIKPGYDCVLPITFKIEPNNAYQLRFNWNFENKKCQASAAAFRNDSTTQQEYITVSKQANDCKTGLDRPAF